MGYQGLKGKYGLPRQGLKDKDGLPRERVKIDYFGLKGNDELPGG